jgi:hypothetical protein
VTASFQEESDPQLPSVKRSHLVVVKWLILLQMDSSSNVSRAASAALRAALNTNVRIIVCISYTKSVPYQDGYQAYSKLPTALKLYASPFAPRRARPRIETTGQPPMEGEPRGALLRHLFDLRSALDAESCDRVLSEDVWLSKRSKPATNLKTLTATQEKYVRCNVGERCHRCFDSNA